MLSFDGLSCFPPDPILDIVRRFNEDVFPDKVDLWVGMLKADDWSVLKHELISTLVLAYNPEDHGYLTMDGYKPYIEAVVDFVLDTKNISTIAWVCTVGGTGAVSSGFNMHARVAKQCVKADPSVIIWSSSWWNYKALAQREWMNIQEVNHLNPENNIDMNAYKDAIMNVSPWTMLVVQAGDSHNTTGRNFDRQQFIDELIPLINQKNIHVLIDCAYLGLWWTYNDERAIAQSLRNKIDSISLAYSSSKNLTLYNERVWAFLYKVADKDERELIQWNLEHHVRGNYSGAPHMWPFVATEAMTTYRNELLDVLDIQQKSLVEKRSKFASMLGEWFGYIAKGSGMFTILKLDAKQIERLEKDYHIYMLSTGRINISWLNDANMGYVVESVKAVMTNS